jgi:type II secretion system protein H
MILGVRNRGGKRGFTLIELMVVIVLISILTAMIVPEMRGTFQDALLRSTARKLVDVLTLANSSAITTSRPHVVQLDIRGSRYRIEKGSKESEQAGTPSSREVTGGEGNIDPRISIRVRKVEEEPDDESERVPESRKDSDKPVPQGDISFYPDGTADAAEITLRDHDGFALALRINPATSRVQIVEMGREL